MTVKAAKEVIASALEDLQAQGVFVRGIELTWSADVVPEDREKLDTKIRCKVSLDAEL